LLQGLRRNEGGPDHPAQGTKSQGASVRPVVTLGGSVGRDQTSVCRPSFEGSGHRPRRRLLRWEGLPRGGHAEAAGASRGQMGRGRGFSRAPADMLKGPSRRRSAERIQRQDPRGIRRGRGTANRIWSGPAGNKDVRTGFHGRGLGAGGLVKGANEHYDINTEAVFLIRPGGDPAAGRAELHRDPLHSELNSRPSASSKEVKTRPPAAPSALNHRPGPLGRGSGENSWGRREAAPVLTSTSFVQARLFYTAAVRR